MTQGKIIDCDAHICEPPDLWVKNLPAKYRERAMRMEVDKEGVEYLVIEGRKEKWSGPGSLGCLSSAGLPGEVVFSTKHRYLDGHPGAYDPHARVKKLDEDGIDAALIYPSLSLRWEYDVQDTQLAAAYCQVYNDWLVDWCRPYPDRLIPIAHISLMDVEEGIKELKRVAKKGMKGVMLDPYPANKRGYGDRYYDPFWAEAQEMGLPVALHVNGRKDFLGHEWYPEELDLSTAPIFYIMTTTGFFVRAGFTDMFRGAVFEHFPRLKLIVLETGVGWLKFWLERMDNKWEYCGFTTGLKQRPSEYFQRQCWVSIDTDETTIEYMVQQYGADKFFWATDFPHFDAPKDPVGLLKERIQGLPQSDQQKILGDNVAKEYNL